ncbi:SRPBCC family protein [Methylorubrum populi]
MVVFMRIALLAAAALAVTGVTAKAQHAPTRRKIVETVAIDAPADKVWAVVGNPADAGWIDSVARAAQEGTPEKPSYRLILKNGHAIVEETRKLDPERRSFAYYIVTNDVADLPAKDYSATISVQPEGEHAARVEWKAAFYRGHPNNDPPPELNDENSEKRVRAWVHASLENLKARLEKGGS